MSYNLHWSIRVSAEVLKVKLASMNTFNIELLCYSFGRQDFAKSDMKHIRIYISVYISVSINQAIQRKRN